MVGGNPVPPGSMVVGASAIVALAVHRQLCQHSSLLASAGGQVAEGRHQLAVRFKIARKKSATAGGASDHFIGVGKEAG